MKNNFVKQAQCCPTQAKLSDDHYGMHNAACRCQAALVTQLDPLLMEFKP